MSFPAGLHTGRLFTSMDDVRISGYVEPSLSDTATFLVVAADGSDFRVVGCWGRGVDEAAAASTEAVRGSSGLMPRKGRACLRDSNQYGIEVLGRGFGSRTEEVQALHHLDVQ